ncbi:MAG: hypothetical protein V4808_16575 [Pseudomonadota bacterium]
MQRADLTSSAAIHAMIAATVLAALLQSAGIGALPLFPFAFPVALLVTMPLGMLLYAAARATGYAGWVTAALGGLLISAILWLPDLLSPPTFDEQWRDGVASVTAGHYTLRGWFEHLIPITGSASAGLISGLFFWFYLVRRTLSSGARRGAWTLTGLAVTGAILYPFAMQDRSCHSAYSRPTIAQLGIAIPADQWLALAQELNDFARTGSWSVHENLSASTGLSWLDFSLCEADGNRISVLAAHEIDLPVSVSLTQLQDDSDWKPVFRALHDRLKARWPGAIRYQTAQGLKASGPPEWLVSPKPSSAAR